MKPIDIFLDVCRMWRAVYVYVCMSMAARATQEGWMPLCVVHVWLWLVRRMSAMENSLLVVLRWLFACYLENLIQGKLLNALKLHGHTIKGRLTLPVPVVVALSCVAVVSYGFPPALAVDSGNGEENIGMATTQSRRKASARYCVKTMMAYDWSWKRQKWQKRQRRRASNKFNPFIHYAYCFLYPFYRFYQFTSIHRRAWR